VLQNDGLGPGSRVPCCKPCLLPNEYPAMAGQNGRSLVGRIQGQGCCIGKLDAVQTVCSGLAQVPLTDEHGTAVPGTLIHPVCQKALQEAHCQKRAAVRLPRKVLHLPGCCWSCATIERKRRPAPRRQWGGNHQGLPTGPAALLTRPACDLGPPAIALARSKPASSKLHTSRASTRRGSCFLSEGLRSRADLTASACRLAPASAS